MRSGYDGADGRTFSVAVMMTVDVDVVLEALGVRADGGAAPPTGGMSGSALVGARTEQDDPVVVKVTELATTSEADRARRELHVYTAIARLCPVPAPRLLAAHETASWIAIALERHEPPQQPPAWTLDQWIDLARLLGRMHSRARTIEAVPPAEAPDKPRARDNLLVFAGRLWNGPGDAARLEEVVDHLDLLHGAIDGGPRSFVHGDSHLGNVVTTSASHQLLVDWQSAHVGPSTGDVAFALTRAAAVVDTLPRHQVIDAYSDAAGVDLAPTHRAVTAHQLLTLVEQYPEFAAFLDPNDVNRLRRAFDGLLREWKGND